MFSGCVDGARLHEFLARGLRSRPIWASVLFTWGVSSVWAKLLISVWGGRSTLAGRMFTTDLRNKNLSCDQKTLEKAVPVMFFEFCYSQPDKTMTNPNWKFFRFTWISGLYWTFSTVVLTESKVGAYWNLCKSLVWHKRGWPVE